MRIGTGHRYIMLEMKVMKVEGGIGCNYAVEMGIYREDIILKWPQNRCERV